jgi:hypothetical protein
METSQAPSTDTGTIQRISTSDIMGLIMILATEEAERFRKDLEPWDLMAFFEMVVRCRTYPSTWDDDVKVAHAQLRRVQCLATDWMLPQK